MTEASHPLDRVFRARSVAVIGVSADAHKLTGAPIAILKATKFPGAIYPVNPKYTEVQGVRCYPSVASLPEAPDVALIVVRAEQVPQTLEECGRLGTRAAVVISSGFEEVQGQESLVGRVREVCERYGIALVGPNCEGVWSVGSRVLLTFGSAARREHLAHRPVAILSHSGSVAGAIARHLQDSGFGCSYVVSTGNETMISLLDYLEYLIEQDDVRVVLMFLEGIVGGERLPALAARARARGIHLVALKAGNSRAGSEAVASHTGRVATSYAVYRDVFAQCGILPVASLTELLEAAEVLTTLPLPRKTTSPDSGLSVFSVPGGTRSLTVDLAESLDVPLARFTEPTVAALTAILPQFGYAQNPTDLTGHVLSAPQMMNDALGHVAGDPNTEALIMQLANRGPRDAAERRELLRDAARTYGVPMVLTFLGDALAGPARREFAEDGLYVARDANDAVRYMAWLYRCREHLALPAPPPAAVPGACKPAPRDWPGMMQMLADAGITVPRWTLVPAATGIDGVARKVGYPMAVKALPEDAEHKTEKGLLRLNVRTRIQLAETCTDLRARLGRADATLLAQAMAPAGVETVLSVRRDKDFGAVLSIGSGGVMVELARDIGHLCVPVGRADVERLIARLKLAQMLAGFRGAPRADTAALVSAALGLARIVHAYDVAEIEVNPLIVLPEGQGAVAVDVLVTPAPAGL